MIRREQGQSTIEYALVVALVSIVIAVALFGVVDGIIPEASDRVAAAF